MNWIDFNYVANNNTFLDDRHYLVYTWESNKHDKFNRMMRTKLVCKKSRLQLSSVSYHGTTKSSLHVCFAFSMKNCDFGAAQHFSIGSSEYFAVSGHLRFKS